LARRIKRWKQKAVLGKGSREGESENQRGERSDENCARGQ